MTMHVPALAALGLFLTACTSPAFGADEKATENAKARMAAAQKAYKGTLGRWQTDSNAPNPAEMLYQWSRRWLEAERELATTKEGRAAAAGAHLDRMKKLEDLVRQWHRKGFVSELDVTSLEFYRLEAEHWLAREKGD